MGKPVLLTRVVDTMINTPRPTRAEATGGWDGAVIAVMDIPGNVGLDAAGRIATKLWTVVW